MSLSGEIDGSQIRHLKATRFIRTMWGGSQSKLMECSDGQRYIVKQQNNPQGTRTLANELLGTLLARSLGLATPQPAIVHVSGDLIESADLRFESQLGMKPCDAGTCFGSQYFMPRIPASYRSMHFEPGSPSSGYLRVLGNLNDFAGMLVFDKWTGNTDGRQIVFVREGDDRPDRAIMIDFGCCFHASDWTFRDRHMQGIFVEPFVYNWIKGIEAFEPWLQILEHGTSEAALRCFAAVVPKEWYGEDQEGLERLVSCLNQRRQLVRTLLRDSCCAVQHSFRNWNRATQDHHASTRITLKKRRASSDCRYGKRTFIRW